MDWNCTVTEERLSDFLEGTLALPERDACAAHAEACASCSEILARVGALVTDMHALEELPEPSHLARRIINNTRPTPRRGQEFSSWSGWLSLIWQPRFAIGLATVAVTAVILAHAARPQLSRLTPADLNPVNLVRAGNRQAHLTYARGEKFVNDLRVVYEIRAMLASPTQAEPGNQGTPSSGARPNTSEHEDETQQRSEARVERGSMVWAMLFPFTDEGAPPSANRRTP
ncbi:MAG TPA: zf-HC2 domain-containing protein [Candidatus Dormibacteraeota bacterium]|nr:zf-HC2 domain-containing protein [Candidatus Dormibacteraeota bacterium]